jgi:hypothetical protein
MVQDMLTSDTILRDLFNCLRTRVYGEGCMGW